MYNNYRHLHQIRLYGIPPYIDIRKVVSVNVAGSLVKPVGLHNALSGLYYYFRNALFQFNFYKYGIKANSQFLLFYGRCNIRKDHLKTFLDFARNFPDADIVYADFKKREICPLRFFSRFFLFMVWTAQLLYKKNSFYEACCIVKNLQWCYDLNKEIVRIIGKPYKFVTVYSDTAPDENYLVQYCKKLRIKTMTLQHGIFAKKENVKTLADTGFELVDSISDYYLAWNQYTKDEGIKVGLRPNRIIILGCIKYINYQEPYIPIHSYNNIFGVILNNKSFDYHNRELIKMANDISAFLGLKYILRYHPQYKRTEYDSLCGEGFLGTNNNDMTIKEYAEEVSFTIMSSSSVFVDLLLLKHPTFRLIISDDDTYSNVQYNSFRTIEELKELLEVGQQENPAFDYLCNSYDTYHNYRVFFDKMKN